MKKTINPYWKARLFWLFMIIAAVLAWTFSGCSPAKVAARKDQKAIDRVLTSPQLLQTAYARGAELWPCANDTQFVMKPGRIDSLYFPVMYDTTDRERIKDSLLDGIVSPFQDQCNEKIKNAFDLGVEVTAKEFAKMKIPVRRPDTLAGFIVDRNLAKALLDTIGKKKQEIAEWKGRAAESEKTAAKEAAQKYRLFWLLLLSVALLVGSNVAWVINKTKKPL